MKPTMAPSMLITASRREDVTGSGSTGFIPATAFVLRLMM